MDKLLKNFDHCPQTIDDLINEVIDEMVEPEVKQVLEAVYDEREANIEALRQRQVLDLNKP